MPTPDDTIPAQRELRLLTLACTLSGLIASFHDCHTALVLWVIAFALQSIRVITLQAELRKRDGGCQR